MRPRRLALRAALVLPTLGLAIGALAAPASAHAYLVASLPADGAVLSTAPTELTLRLSESVEEGSTTADLTDGRGRHLAPTSIRVARSDPKDRESPVTIRIGLPPLPVDTYRLAWRSVSSDDLHDTSGAVVFGVRHAVTPAATGEMPPRPLEAVLRWISLLGAAALVGAGGLGYLLRRPPDPASAARATRRALAAGTAGGLTALAASGGLLAEQLSATRSSLSLLTGTPYGARWLVAQAGLALATMAAALGWRRARAAGPAQLRPGRGLLLAAGLGIALAAVGTVLLGHAGAGRPVSPTRVGLTAAHLLAAAAWAGTLALGATLLLPLLRQGPAPAETARRAFRRFGVLAGACLAVLAGSGLLLAADTVASVDALLLTAYGRVLAAKVALAGVAALLGLANAVRLHGRRRHSPALRRTVGAEALAAIALLGLAGLLASAQPATGPRWARPAPPVATEPLVSGSAADLQESLSVKPNLPGRNFVTVGVFDTRRPAPAPIGSVRVQLRPPGGGPVRGVALRPLPGGEWGTSLDDLDTAGGWTITVSVDRTGLPTASADYPWAVARPPGPAARAPVLSNAPLRPLLTAAAGVVALLALGAGLVLRRRQNLGSGHAPADLPHPRAPGPGRRPLRAPGR